jgi:hypothetical protein
MGRNINNLKSDGHGWRARLGVLTHDDSAISESELWTMAPDGVSLHTSRVFFADLATFADPPGPDDAAELLARLPLQAIIYAWTVGSYLLGTTGEKGLVSRVQQHSKGIPVLMSAAAATAGFRTLEVERIALIHAPFFTDEFDQKGATCRLVWRAILRPVLLDADPESSRIHRGDFDRDCAGHRHALLHRVWRLVRQDRPQADLTRGICACGGELFLHFSGPHALR